MSLQPAEHPRPALGMLGRGFAESFETAMADGEPGAAGGRFQKIGERRFVTAERRMVPVVPPDRADPALRLGHPTLGRHETTLAYLLEPAAGGTRLTICHGGFEGFSEAAAEHAEGWARVLGWLQGYLGSAGRVAA